MILYITEKLNCANQTINLNGTAINNWIAEDAIHSLFYDSQNDVTWMTLNNGKYVPFQYYTFLIEEHKDYELYKKMLKKERLWSEA